MQTLSELVGHLKVVYTTASRFAAALGLPPLVRPVDEISDRY